jgi:hypothetical protein
MPSYKYEPELCQRIAAVNCTVTGFVITDQSARTNTPRTVLLDKTIKAASSIDVAISNTHNLHSTIT